MRVEHVVLERLKESRNMVTKHEQGTNLLRFELRRSEFEALRAANTAVGIVSIRRVAFMDTTREGM